MADHASLIANARSEALKRAKVDGVGAFLLLELCTALEAEAGLTGPDPVELAHLRPPPATSVEATRELTANVQKSIRAVMAQNELSQTDLAARLNITRARLSQALGDRPNLTIQSIAKIFHALGEIPRFVTGRNQDPPTQADHDIQALTERCTTAEAALDRLQTTINSAQTDDWLAAVPFEVAHQAERWGDEHDAGKSHADWYWLIGRLAGKALTAAGQNDLDQARHHTITTGAVLLKWHCRLKATP